MRSGLAAKIGRGVARAVLALGLIAAAVFAAFGYFDRDPVNLYPARGPAKPVAVVNFQGTWACASCLEPPRRGA